MATRFLKIDLSSTSRDFEHFALEPGAPLLDRDGMNRRILQKWLGRLVADPEWKDLELPLDDDEVAMFVSPGEGERLQEVSCEPVTREEIDKTKSLRDDLEALRTGLKNARPGGGRDVKLREAIIRNFNAVLATDGLPQHEFCFFKYLDGKQWRLVWAWGYQRRDRKVQGASVICTNPKCRQLFVKRQEGSRDCPGCKAPVRGGPARAEGRRSRGGVVALLLTLIVLAAAAGYLLRDRWRQIVPGPSEMAAKELVVAPATWKGPSGSQLEFTIQRRGDDGQLEDVTRQVVPVSENPKIVRVETGGARIVARSHGKTAVHFYLGELTTHVTVDVEPPENPRTIRLEPAELTLGVGTTEQLRVLAEFPDRPPVDVSDLAEWEPISATTLAGHAGRVEGVAAGEATVVARYRATADDPYRTAQARVRVVAEQYSRLEIKLDPPEIVEGNSGRLAVSVFDQAGQARSVLQSSLLRLELDGSGVAEIDADGLYVLGRKAGSGQVRATFGPSLTASASFKVTNDLTGRFAVAPKDLRLMVGELYELQVTTASSEPVRVTSSSKEVVEVVDGTRVVGRSVGKAELLVAQEAREEKVDVEVTAPELSGIVFVPPRVAAPLDRAVPLRLVGRSKNGQEFDLAPDAFIWEKVPSPAVVELDVRKLELRGRALTGDSPQEAVARLGEFRARATIDVTNSPLQIELTPAGPVQLPEGQTVTLHAWARYGDGTRTEIDASRLEWHVTPTEAAGLRLEKATGTARGVKAGDSLLVSVNYQGYESNRVELRCTFEDLPLALHSDRSLILVGDRGELQATVQGAPPDFALSGVRFESSDPSVLEVDPRLGTYRALAVGRATVTASHPNAKAPATATLEVAQEAILAIRPERIKLLVNARQTLDLVRISGAREERVPFVDPARSPRVSVAQPLAVRWHAPYLVGLAEAAPFEIAIEYGGQTARAVVEVVAGGGDIRISPAQVKLSPGQAHSPAVEQQVSGEESWQEIEPMLVSWKVPEGLRWIPARADLRPQLTPADDAQGTLTLEAQYGKKQTKLAVEVGGSVSLQGPLEVVREPSGEALAVDELQRYTIVVRQGDQTAPAVGVRWQPAFENDYVRWAPPVLFAKRPGHEQVLTARVGDETVSFRTRTIETGPALVEPPAPSDAPAEVRLMADAPQPITLPLRARFGGFRVEAVYPGRPPANVTREALLEIVASGDPPAPLSVADAQLLAQRVGAAELRASYCGVSAPTGLRFDVVQEAPLTELAVSPSRVRLEVGETAPVRVEGFVLAGGSRSSVGDVSGLPALSWSSEQPGLVKVDGPRLTGVSPGQAKVMVRAGAASASFDVEVVTSARVAGDSLIVSPQLLRLKVGESKRLGRDVQVRRGELLLTEQCDANSSDAGIVRVDRDSRSLVGVAPGQTLVTLGAGNGSAVLRVEVEGAAPNVGRVAIEPAGGAIGIGEALDLRVYVIGPQGERTDRTGVAFNGQSSDPQVLSMARRRITGVAAGSARVTIEVPGIAEPGEATFQVEDAKFTQLVVTPSPLRLAVGQRREIQIEAVGPGGRRTLGDHPDLKLTVGGANPRSIERNAGREIRGVAPGEAEVTVAWRDLAAPPLPVVVTFVPVSGLRIEPPSIDVAVQRREAFRVMILQGDQERVATSADDVRLSVADPTIALAQRDFAVRGNAPGATSLTAQLGSQRAMAQVRVAPSGQDPAHNMPPGLRFIPDVLTMQLGVPGGPFRLVKISPDGVVADKRLNADYEIFPDAAKEVVSINHTGADGPVFVATKVGRAQVRAKVDGQVTPQPLIIDVYDPSQPPPHQEPARLEVQPDPVRLSAGASAGLRRVRIIPPDGEPFDVDHQIQSANEQIVAVDDGKKLRGLRAGQTQIMVVPVNAPAPFADLKAEVTVQVDAAEPPSSESPGVGQGRLVLSGPSRATVGAPTNYRVELSGDHGTRDVTNDNAALVIDKVGAADAEAGCVLVPRQPTTLRVRARYKDLVSNDVTVQIDPPLDVTDVERLELEVDLRPLTVGERRPYVVWGYPIGGGARRDLTAQVRTGTMDGPRGGKPVLVHLAPESAASIVSHSPPALIARAPGEFKVSAEFGAARSPEVALRIVPADNAGPRRFTAEPSMVTIHVGQHTPELRVTAFEGERSRTVDAAWSSENEQIAAADAEQPGRFVGRGIGRTRLKATFQGREATTVEVIVTGDAFEDVVLPKNPNPEKDNRFSITATIQLTNSTEQSLEYRIVPAGQAESDVAWKPAPIGEHQKLLLVSPPIRRGAADAVYRLDIQARDKQQRKVAVYPLTFTVKTDESIKPQSKGGP